MEVQTTFSSVHPPEAVVLKYQIFLFIPASRVHPFNMTGSMSELYSLMVLLHQKSVMELPSLERLTPKYLKFFNSLSLLASCSPKR